MVSVTDYHERVLESIPGKVKTFFTVKSLNQLNSIQLNAKLITSNDLLTF